MNTNNENKKGFLVFKRRKGEGFIINGSIEVFVGKIGKNYASIIVRSPKGTKILRAELEPEKKNGPGKI